MKHTTISLDLAKNVIQVCKITKHGEISLNQAMSPSKAEQVLAQSAPCVVAMEGCGSFNQ